jgi:ParB-like chromosome segregation protein Spo0J
VFSDDKVYKKIKENPDHQPPNFQVMPPLSVEEYQALKESIAERGLDVPILVGPDETIVDGHHRQRVMEELEAEGREIPDGN